MAGRGKVWLVGAGPGDPGLLTLKAARALAQCDVLVYDYLASPAIVALAPPDCEKIYAGKQAGAHTLSQDEITALIVRLGSAGKNVVRLKGGDVFVFARGGEEARALADAGVPFEIVPGITSAIAAPAYAGIPVTHRDHNTAFTIATGHEDPTKGYSSLDFAKLANPKATTIFLMAMGNLAGIVGELRAHGLPGTTPVAIVHEGTKPSQRVVTATIDTIVAEVARSGIGAPAIVVIGDVVTEREHLRWFDLQPLFGKRVLVTRPAHQAGNFATRLWEAGAEPIVAPTIAIGPPSDPQPARDAVAQVRDYAWVAFTSRNGVDAFFDRLGELGSVTGRMHATLSSAPDDPDFAPEEPTVETISLLIATIDELIERTFDDLPDLPQLAAIAGRGEEVRDHLRSLSHIGVRGRLIRVHGDYHLGQTVLGSDGWVILDFEGEPARPLLERRRKRSPLRDVAGMLRSFSYAAAAAEFQRGARVPDGWEQEARARFLEGYMASADPAILPIGQASVEKLLAILELERALYELTYDLNNRPDWVPIPVASITRLLRRPEA